MIHIIIQFENGEIVATARFQKRIATMDPASAAAVFHPRKNEDPEEWFLLSGTPDLF
jgi:hypothetical protein